MQKVERKLNPPPRQPVQLIVDTESGDSVAEKKREFAASYGMEVDEIEFIVMDVPNIQKK
jgi:hypothetical protein